MNLEEEIVMMPAIMEKGKQVRCRGMGCIADKGV